MKNLNTSSMAALLAGGGIALLPLDSLAEPFIGVAICARLRLASLTQQRFAIAFVLLTAANHHIKGIK
jgi:hypothetical protein